MSAIRVIKAKVSAEGVVSLGDIEAPDIEIIGEGQAEGEGYAVITDESAIFIINTQPDLSDTIAKLITITEQMITLTDTELALGGTGSIPLKPYSGLKPALEQVKTELEDKKLL